MLNIQRDKHNMLVDPTTIHATTWSDWAVFHSRFLTGKSCVCDSFISFNGISFKAMPTVADIVLPH